MDDLNALTDLHCQAFPESRSTRLGKRYMRKMFRWFLEKQPKLCLGIEQEGQLAGYVVGAIGGYGRKIFRYAIIEVILGLLLHPGLWFRRGTFTLWHSYLQAFLPNKKPRAIPELREAPSVVNASLAGIGVAPKMQGKRIGKALMIAFEQAALSQGAGKLTLSVNMDNLAARRLYEGCNWKVDSEEPQRNSVHYSKTIFSR